MRKSTLVKTVLGTLAPVSGDIDWPQGRPNSIAYLGQQTEFDTRFPMRVRDLTEMGSWPALGFSGRMHAQRRSLVKSALERAGIARYIADMSIHKLSAVNFKELCSRGPSFRLACNFAGRTLHFGRSDHRIRLTNPDRRLVQRRAHHPTRSARFIRGPSALHTGSTDGQRLNDKRLTARNFDATEPHRLRLPLGEPGRLARIHVPPGPKHVPRTPRCLSGFNTSSWSGRS